MYASKNRNKKIIENNGNVRQLLPKGAPSNTSTTATKCMEAVTSRSDLPIILLCVHSKGLVAAMVVSILALQQLQTGSSN